MIGPMDVLIHINKDTIRTLLPLTPKDFYPFSTEDIIDASPAITFYHIGPTMNPVLTSANCHIQPTTTIDDCPKLDYLLVGGPLKPYYTNVPENMMRFMLQRSKEVKSIFTTCSGGIVLASTGILDGLKATSNHMCLRDAREWYPQVKWTDEAHWVVNRPTDDAVKNKGVPLPCEIWTSAGAGSGMDMMADWIKTEFGTDLGSKLLGMATSLLEWRPSDINGRPMEYVNGKGKWVAA